jgi:hypothetical protein
MVGFEQRCCKILLSAKLLAAAKSWHLDIAIDSTETLPLFFLSFIYLSIFYFGKMVNKIAF